MKGKKKEGGIDIDFTEFELPDMDLEIPEFPELEFPDFDLEFPDLNLEFPDMQLDFPDLNLDFPDIDMDSCSGETAVKQLAHNLTAERQEELRSQQDQLVSAMVRVTADDRTSEQKYSDGIQSMLNNVNNRRR